MTFSPGDMASLTRNEDAKSYPPLVEVVEVTDDKIRFAWINKNEARGKGRRPPRRIPEKAKARRDVFESMYVKVEE